jgi:hypothetical protein
MKKAWDLCPALHLVNRVKAFIRMTIAASDEDVEAGFRKIVEWAERQ